MVPEIQGMVIAAKAFIIREEVDLDTITAKLRTLSITEPWEEGGRRFELRTEVEDLRVVEDRLEGIFSQDQIITIRQRGELVPIPRTIRAPFTFSQYKGRILLVVYEKKERANNIANQMSKTLFITTGRIVEARIAPEVLEDFHKKNFEDTKVIFFDDVDLPNINKLSLYGSTLGDTRLYSDYLTHGKIWYVVVKSRKYGYIVGVTRNCVVTVFTRIEFPDFFPYISNEVFPLIA